MEDRTLRGRRLRQGQLRDFSVWRASAGLARWVGSLLRRDSGHQSQLLRYLVCGLAGCWLLGGSLAQAFSGTGTGSPLNLQLPTSDSYDWADQVNWNFTTINSSFTTITSSFSSVGASTAAIYSALQSTGGALTAEIARATAAEALKVAKTGDTMTGRLNGTDITMTYGINTASGSITNLAVSSLTAASSITVTDGGWMGRNYLTNFMWDAAADGNLGAAVFMSSSGMTFSVDSDGNDSEVITFQKNARLTGAGTNLMVLTQSAELYGMAEVNGTKGLFGTGSVGTNCSTCTVAIRAQGGGLSVEGGTIQGSYGVKSSTAVFGTNTSDPTAFTLTVSSGYTALDTYTESISTFGASSSLPGNAIYWSSAAVVQITLTNSPTWTFQGAKAGQHLVMYIKQDGVGSRTVTWPTISWAAATAPTLTTTANKRDIVSIFYDGAEYFGFSGGSNY